MNYYKEVRLISAMMLPITLVFFFLSLFFLFNIIFPGNLYYRVEVSDLPETTGGVKRQQLSESYFYIDGDPLVLYYESDQPPTYGKYLLETQGSNKQELVLHEEEYNVCQIDDLKRSPDNTMFLIQRHCGDAVFKYLIGVENAGSGKFEDLMSLGKVELDDHFEDSYEERAHVLGWLDNSRILVRQVNRDLDGEVSEDYYWYAEIDDLDERTVLELE